LIEIVIQNDYAQIARVNQAFENPVDGHVLPESLLLKLKTVLDELLGNVIMHGYGDQQRHDITTRIDCSADLLVVTIIDDGRAFNPVQFPAPDVDVRLEDRKIGGLGIHIARNLMDDISYQRLGDKNVLTLAKEIKFTDPATHKRTHNG
jgi:serine/threonine-protein kinase RsbW